MRHDRPKGRRDRPGCEETKALAQTASLETAPGLVDDLPLSAFQVWAVLMAAATVILDGLDNQMLGLAAPSLIKEWGVAKEALGVVFAFGFVGMAFGTLTSGWMGDRFGRRGALIFGVAVFGIATLATGFAADLTQVGILRTIAGVGLGGIPGTASAMIAEFTPPRWRSIAVTFGVVCVSIGGVLGGIAASLIVPTLGWRWLFYLGGGISVLFVAVLHFLMPESPRYLAGRPERAGELTALLRRIGHPSPETVHLPVAGTSAAPAFVPMRALIGPTLLRDTLALALAMFSGMFMIYLMFNWAPTLLFSEGFAMGTAGSGLTAFNLGGTIGAMCASLAIMRFGSRGTLVVMALGGTAACVFLALLPISGGRNEGALLAGLGALGLTASAAQSAMFAVGAHAFPTAVRARGLGLMGASGRVGAVLSALMGALLIGHGNLGFFGTLAALMFVNAIGFVAVRGHIPRLVRQTAIPI